MKLLNYEIMKAKLNSEVGNIIKSLMEIAAIHEDALRANNYYIANKVGVSLDDKSIKRLAFELAKKEVSEAILKKQN